ARRHGFEALFRAGAGQHHGRVFRRPDLRRQPRHGVLEDGRLSRRAVRLPPLYRVAQPEAGSGSVIDHRRRILECEGVEMIKKLPATDVVVIGLGWAGSIIANELADEGLDVIALERGPWRDTARDFNIASVTDELRYLRRQELMLRPMQNAVTVR